MSVCGKTADVVNKNRLNWQITRQVQKEITKIITPLKKSYNTHMHHNFPSAVYSSCVYIYSPASTMTKDTHVLQSTPTVLSVNFTKQQEY